jgi:hypothetical protein
MGLFKIKGGFLVFEKYLKILIITFVKTRSIDNF